jgi:hypothetical protein
VSYEKVGDMLVAQGNFGDAMKSYQSSLAIRNRLVRSDPGNTGWQRDLIFFWVKISGTFPSEGKAMLIRAIEIANHLRDEGRLAPADAWMPDELKRRLETLRE